MSTRNPSRSPAARALRPALATLAAATLALALSACSDGGGSGGEITLDVENPDRCDPLDPRHCMLPFPNDFFSVEDDSTPTGRRIHLQAESLPANIEGVHVDPTEWNRNDGFSPGPLIATFVPGIDLAQSGVAPLTDLERSFDDDAAIVILEVATGVRKPHWGELDASVSAGADRMLLVRPAINLLEGHRYIVALRHIRDAAGNEIAPSDAFRALRDDLRTNVPELEARREHFEEIFADLEEAGVAREDLFLAWDFTISSRESLTERILHMRDEAFAALGDRAPAFTVSSVEENPDDRLARIVRGTFEVPNYLTNGGQPPARLVYGADGLPQSEGVFRATFVCVVPHAALAGADGSAVPARPSLYGHGLLGSDEEVDAGNIRDMANEHNFVFCATKWLGMSEDDVVNAAFILQDLGKFPTLADRAQQGFLDFLFLGRLMIHADGLVSHPAFQDAAGRGVIDRSELFYDGNSQGGIMGGALTAVATDFTRAVLGVPGMNYSTLLQRSVDWVDYRLVYDASYLDELERGLGLILIQMLWDRAEANGYAHHLTDDPLPGTPAHKVLLHVAFGDWQVAQCTAEVEARTADIPIHTPAVKPGLLPDVTPFWGITPLPPTPFDGSALIIWDSGTPAPPIDNVAPSVGRDPHADPRSYVVARRQKAEFLKTNGAVIDVCEGAPCMAPPR